MTAPLALRIVGVCGSLRAGSHNLRLLEAAALILPAEVHFERYTELKSIPPFDEDDEDEEPPPVARWRGALIRADGILIATPEYNSSIPGQLKNAIDWASRPVGSAALRSKNVAVLGASTSMFGAIWSAAETRKALAAAGARVVDRELAVAAAHEQFGPDGKLIDTELCRALQGLVDELVAAVRTTIGLRSAVP